VRLTHPQLLGADRFTAERGETSKPLRLRGVGTDVRRLDVVHHISPGLPWSCHLRGEPALMAIFEA